ncbi:MAG: tRNA (N(6)-L-threonylcarbamoyladenosine(37)-C(2))-methylthiotransferase [Candidatus Pacebacteria bacterium]|nr:tRNA (N(6)-L-threonylcarbamoyladenosine(37)-C(2))-methylthiotransferase [Candidatus Paceibacterota bacterium]
MKFYLQTYGCKLNQSDSELIKGILSRKFIEATSEKEADFVIFNTCAVVKKTEDKILKTAKFLKNKGKKIIIAGCLPSVCPEKCQEIADGIIGATNLRDIGKIAGSVLKNKKISLLKKEFIDKADLCNLKKREGKTNSAIVAVSEGCLGNCSYCATKSARRELNSFNMGSIIKEIKGALNKEYKEIQLTSQDMAVYGADKGKQTLPELLQKISGIDGGFRVKIGMMNPGAAKPIFEKLLKTMESPKFYKFLHLPLQSGSDELLKQMKRGYKAKDFAAISKKFRKKFRNGVLATDIIAGHPLETEKDFAETVKILKQTKPDIVHIFKFSARPNTDDVKLKDIPDRIKKDRSRILTKIFEETNAKRNKKFIGKKQEVLIIKKEKTGCLARNDSGRAVIIKNAGKSIGSFAKIRITGSKWNYLLGELA